MPEDRPTGAARPPTPEEDMRAYTVGELNRHDGPVTLVEYDPAWPDLYAREERRLREALGDRAIRIEHTGSTSVPGLAAKPIIDIVLVVADSADEAAYIPALEAAGYVLRIREPDWFEHRLFKGPDTNVNVHTFSAGCPEIERMVAFRDWLRSNDEDRRRYEAAKRELAGRDWQYVQHYADAKTEVVEEIIGRALAPDAGP
ncbi:MAG TPA: GrpB family protein [Candidatus Limnocylindrales bacterium]|nr:GrpB family protein [Candidatus Limnocylindrales bacterium]